MSESETTLSFPAAAPRYETSYLGLKDGESWPFDILEPSASSQPGTAKCLGPLTSLNVFLGANNSGKSRVLRELFCQWDLYRLGHRVVRDNRDRVKDALRTISRLSEFVNGAALLTPASNSVASIRQQAKVLVDSMDGECKPHEVVKATDLIVRVHKKIGRIEGRPIDLNSGVVDKAREQLQTIWSEMRLPSSSRPCRVYVPALRSLRAFDRAWMPDDRIAGETRAQFAWNSNTREWTGAVDQGLPIVLAGQNLYGHFRRHLLGSLDERRLMEAFQQYLGRWFFDNYEVALIPKESDPLTGESHSLYVKIGNEKEQPVQHLGDGVSQLIVLLYPMFMFRDHDLLLFIEEPENYLHPGFQRRLIDAMIKPEREGGVPLGPNGSRQVFVATHSNQFLDLTLESDRVSVFRVSKPEAKVDGDEVLPRPRIEVRSTGDMPLLRELGVRNSSVLLANSTVWVEGPSDRMYIRHYVRLLAEDRAKNDATKKIPKEDIDYTIAEYAGSNIEHWCFEDDAGKAGEGKIRVERLCARAMVIADRDSTKESGKDAKSLRLRSLQERLGERFLVLPVREIENLVSAPVLQRVIFEWQHADGGTLALKSFEEADYSQQYLGKFITEKVLPSDINLRKRFYDPKSTGTIADKAEFAKLVIDQTKTADDLSQNARKMAEKVLAFIDQMRGT